jgi:hypothetical protein
VGKREREMKEREREREREREIWRETVYCRKTVLCKIEHLMQDSKIELFQ